MQRNLSAFERIFCATIACFLITALPITDEIAAGLIAIYFLVGWFKKRKKIQSQ
jgi:hypothetical protein